MAWEGSTRRARLPADWPVIRERVLGEAGYACQWVRTDTGALCGRYANQCDHIDAGDDHRRSNLQALCAWHHKRKSSSEGAHARNARAVRRERDVPASPFAARLAARRLSEAS
ncbi:hypothetical protein AN221_23660 [Streptomyces nanshensis]|uniref:HNH endonuclease n=1 Tax=Streptomyces nanshensis TaxID=518642 RepID=A0A1E7LPK7_9ACTN|nr:hypothetical protein AN221_23660 [Streptomyces nanshensis]